MYVKKNNSKWLIKFLVEGKSANWIHVKTGKYETGIQPEALLLRTIVYLYIYSTDVVKHLLSARNELS